MRYNPALVCSLVALSSCVNSMGGRAAEERISGVYVLESVDGTPVPAAIAPQQGCARTVRNGTFTMSAAGPDVLPMYDWSFAIVAVCQPVPPGVFQGTDDVGTWRFGSSEQLSFNSMKNHGAYAATLEEISGSAPAVTIVYLQNSYRFKRIMRWDDPQGVVFAKFVDQAGQPVAGVVVTFTFANGLQGGGTTPATGEFGTGGVVGQCQIGFVVPAGYQIPASQANPFSVTVAQGPALHVQVSLTKL